MQRVLITGASRGIGLEFTRQLLARGDEVFAACRQPETAASLQALATERLHIIRLDVTDAASIEAAFNAVRAQTDALDWLINNAAVGDGDADRFGSLSFDSLLQQFRTNSAAPILIAQRFRDLIARGSNPKIIGLTSGIASLAEKPNGRAIGYSASKTALNMLNRCMAYDLEGITAFVIDPGWVRTDMGGPGAWLEPEESVNHMLDVIDRATPEDRGKFLRWDGAEVAW